MEVTTNGLRPGDDAVQLAQAQTRLNAKTRLYVLCQLAGWGVFLFIQIFYTKAFPNINGPHPSDLFIVCLGVMVVAVGLLLTHFFRPWMRSHGWHQMGWRALVPRALLAAAGLSAIWGIFLDGYAHGFLEESWHSSHSVVFLTLLTILNGSMVFAAWLCLYFFYHVYDRLNRSEIERFQLMTSVKEAELRALKSQVNPHFIFNSLNSLRALIGEDPARARQAVTQLANLLRYSLQSGQQETVSFEEELRIVKDYLALEQVRHEERLSLKMDIAPNTLALPVPPMLLQTLVENAVKYGISPRPEGGEIVVQARRDGEWLRIQVSNPGEIADIAGTSSTGLGLRNAEERLRLIFGSRATLRLLRDLPARVVAEALIPLPAAP